MEGNHMIPEALKASVRVNSIASGTIFKVDHGKQLAYVLSTGHLPAGCRSVELFFEAGHRFRKPLVVPAVSLLAVMNFETGVDFSILQIKVTGHFVHWTPIGQRIEQGTRLLSVGCSGGDYPSHFEVKVLNKRPDRNDYVFQTCCDEKIIGGRSGGGIFHGDNIVGVTWGATGLTEKSSTLGLLTDAGTIRKIMLASGFKHLIKP
jgi:hypothetical protein